MQANWRTYRDMIVAQLLSNPAMTTGQAFTAANRAADEKFGKRQDPVVTLPGEREKPDAATRGARAKCSGILNKLLVSGVFKNRREMNKWACEHLDHSRKNLRVRSFNREECETLLARIDRLERM